MNCKHYSIIFFLLVFFCLNRAAAQEIRIGAIASLTGPAGEQGRNWVSGARFAVKKLESEGIKVTLLVEDDATTPIKAVTAFHSLAGTSKVQAVIGGTWDFLGQAIYPFAAKYSVPVLTPTNPVEILPAEIVSPKDGKSNLVWTNGLSLNAEQRAITEFVDRVKVKRAALLYPTVPFGESHADLFKAVANNSDIEIVYENRFAHDGAYLEGIRLGALKIREFNPDLVFCVTDYAGLDLMMIEFERAGITPMVLTTQHLDEALALSGKPQRYRNVVGVYPEAIADELFRSEFEAQMGAKPKVYAAEGHDAVSFLAHAIRARIDFSASGSQFEWLGVTGLHKLPARNGALVDNKAVLMTVKGQEFSRF